MWRAPVRRRPACEADDYFARHVETVSVETTSEEPASDIDWPLGATEEKTHRGLCGSIGHVWEVAQELR
ncbi:hypothetical protein BS630_26250 [Rhizobium laguerreae]|nr:hypothetical protein BS630_26250 [Rhizobium laguerreae]